MTHFVWEKVWILRNFNFLDESEHSKHFLKKKIWKIFPDSPENFSGLTGKFSGLTGKFSARRTCTYFLYWKMTSTSVVSSTSDIFFHFLKLMTAPSMVYRAHYIHIVQLSFRLYDLHNIWLLLHCQDSYIEIALACHQVDPGTILGRIKIFVISKENSMLASPMTKTD